MASSTKYPTVTSTTNGTAPYSNDDFVSIANVTAIDGTNASITSNTYDATDYSFLAKAQHFDFLIPTGATINGLVVEAGSYATGAVRASWHMMQLLNASGTAEGDNNAVDAGTLPATSITNQTFGGTTDKWGVALTPAMVNNDNFGVQFAILQNTDNADIYVDYVRIIVYYSEVQTEAGASAFALTGVGTIGTTGVKTEAGASAFAVTGVGDIGVTEYVAAEAGSSAFALTATGAASLIEYVASESGPAAFSLSATGAINIVEYAASEAGGAALALTAVGAIDVGTSASAYPEAGASSFATTATGGIVTGWESILAGLEPSTTYHIRAYVTTSAGTGYGEEFDITTPALPVAHSEAGGSAFSLAATGDIAGITEYIASEAGGAAFAITGAGIEAVQSVEAGGSAFAITGSGTSTATRPLGGNTSFIVTATGAIGLVEFVASERGGASFALTASGASDSTYRTGGSAAFNVNATGDLGGVGTTSGAADFSITGVAAVHCWPTNIDLTLTVRESCWQSSVSSPTLAGIVTSGWSATTDEDGWHSHLKRPGRAATIGRPV